MIRGRKCRAERAASVSPRGHRLPLFFFFLATILGACDPEHYGCRDDATVVSGEVTSWRCEQGARISVRRTEEIFARTLIVCRCGNTGDVDGGSH